MEYNIIINKRKPINTKEKFIMMYVAKRTYLNTPGDYESKLFVNALNLEDAMYDFYHTLQDDNDQWYYFQRENGIINGYDVNGVSDEQQARDDVNGEEADEIWEIEEASDDEINSIKSTILDDVKSKTDPDPDYKTWYAVKDNGDLDDGNGSNNPAEAVDMAMRYNSDYIALIYDDGNDNTYETVDVKDYMKM